MKNKANLIRVISFALIITLVPIFIIASPKESISYDENRVLASFPKLSVESYLNEDYMNGISSYISDHFILRTPLISLKNMLERSIMKNEINGILNVDGQLIEIFRNPDENRKTANTSAIESYAKNNKTVFALAPTVQQAVGDNLPFYAYQTDEQEYINDCYSQLQHAVCVDLITPLTQSPDDNYFYYRTDHHWTANGAFAGYAALQSDLGYTAYDKAQFNINNMSDSFLGTLYSKTLDNSVSADSIFKYTLKNDEPKISLYDEQNTLLNSSLYYDSKLNEKDKYSYYFGGNRGVINLESSVESGKKLLVIKDSYANSLLPFLSKHFSQITVVDLRYASPASLQKITAADYDNSLILYNVIGFSEETTLQKLKYIN